MTDATATPAPKPIKVKLTNNRQGGLVVHTLPKPQEIPPGATIETEMLETEVAGLERMGEEVVKVERGGGSSKASGTEKAAGEVEEDDDKGRRTQPSHGRR